MISVNHPLRFLVCDAYPREARDGLQKVGATLAGGLYERLLRRLEPEAQIDVICPADADVALPEGAELAAFDGVVWTGSSLTIYHDDDRRVRQQVDLVRSTDAAGVPSFGSCWAAQIAVVARGGRCAANPKGREFGISRRIALNAVGRVHPMYRHKQPVFDAFTSHADEIVTLPASADLLASNDFSRVQAIAVETGGSFWAVQYHPEYDLHEVARLCVFRCEELVRQGTFRDRAAAEQWIEHLEALHLDPAREDLRASLGIAASLLDETQRTVEVRNWIDVRVKATAATRQASLLHTP